MRTKRFALLTATASLGLAALVSALPSQADPQPLAPNTLPTDCLRVQAGHDSYTATFTQPKKKKDPAVLVSATARTVFDLGVDSTVPPIPSCVGATYTLHVKNYDKTVQNTDGTFGQDSSQTLDYEGFTATPSTGTEAKIDPSEVDITWNGDGSTAEFSATVTTGPNDPSTCVDLWVTIAVAGQQTTETTKAPTCYTDGTGGNTYFG